MKRNILTSLVSLCFTIAYFNINSQIEVDYRLIPSDCEYELTAFLAGAGPDYSATYDWGDGTSSWANWAYVEHVYAEPGVYTVVAVHNGITYVDDVSIEDCGCPEAFEYVQISQQCNAVEARLDTYLWSYGDYSVEWDWGDGISDTSNTYPAGYHTYASEGLYEISATFTGPGCENGVTLVSVVEIEFCDGECYPYVDYYFDETTCSYSFYNETGPENSIWYLDDEFIAEGNWVSNLEIPPGEHVLCNIIEPNDFCPFGQTDCFQITGYDCSENCDFELWSSPIDCQAYEFEIGSASEVSNVTWDLGFGEPFIGGHYEVFTFPEGGEYDVYYSYICLDDNSYYEGVETIIVESCEEECLELFFESTDECNVFEFQYWGDQEDGPALCWEIYGDGDYFELYYDYNITNIEFPGPGTYEVGVTNAVNCDGTLGYFITFEVPECQVLCGEPMQVAENECENVSFLFPENAHSIIINYGDGFINDGMSGPVQEYIYSQPGNYEVCYSYMCGEGDTVTQGCAQFTVLGCGEYCDAGPIITDLGCGLFQFEFNEVASHIMIVANPDPGVVEDDLSFAIASVEDDLIYDYQFLNSGTYTLYVRYWVEECQLLIETYEIEIVVETCEEECPEILTYETDECGTFTFDYIGEITGNSYCWEFWGNDFFYTYFDAESTTFNFTEAGTYYATITNAVLCPDQEDLIIEIIVPECSGNEICIDAVGGIQTGCTTAILTVYAGFEIEEVHWLLNGEVIIAGNNFEYDFGSFENQIIEIAYIPGVDCNDLFEGWEIPVYMDSSWCQEDCYLEIYAQGAESSFEFYSEASDPEASVFWIINGETFQGDFLSYEFTEPGVYEVCAFYESEDCPYGVEDCIEVTVSPTECPEITYELTDDCNTLLFFYEGLIDGSWYCWDAIGEEFYLTYFDGETTSITFPGPGTYQVGVTNGLLCNDLEEYLITIVIPECETECEGLIGVIAQECNEVVFELSESASNIFIDYGDGIIEDDLNGSIHDHVYDEPGIYQVCTEYIDENCGYYVGDCITIEVENCGTDCELEVNIVDNECGFYYIYFPSNDNDLEIDFGDGETYTGNPSWLTHHYPNAGEYLMTVVYYAEDCDQWLTYSHLFVIEEDCDVNCEYEIEYEYLGDNTYVFYASVAEGTWTNWQINGVSNFNQNPFTYTFEEGEGEQQVCFEMETSYCSSNECFYITDEEDECEGVVLSLEGLFEGNESWIQTLECVLLEDGFPIWEDQLNFNSEENLNQLEFCLPQGCYEFSVSNSDPLVLSSMVLLVDLLNDTELDYTFEIDVFEGSASIEFGIGVDCTSSILNEGEVSQVSFYPVPASDIVFIQNIDQLDILEIVDTQGKLIFSSQTTSLQSVDVSDWSQGVYLFRYLENGTWRSRKVQVSH